MRFFQLKIKQRIALLLAVLTFIGCTTPMVTSAQAVEKSTATTEATVQCYASVDGVWTRVGTLSTKQQAKFNGKTRYYLEPAQLEQVYSPYGFTAADYTGTRIFPHTDSDSPQTIWGDCAPILDNETDTYLVPISHRANNYMYYMPANVEGSDVYFNTSTTVDNADVLAQNGFYHVTVTDPGHIIPEDTAYPPPKTHLLRYGESEEIVLPLLDDVQYKVVNGENGKLLDLEQVTDTDKGTVTIKISKINCSVRIATSNGRPFVVYDATLADKLQDLSQYKAYLQEVETDATVCGKADYSESISAGTYTLRSPDSETAVSYVPPAKNGNNRHFVYTFIGWRLGDSTSTLQPGDTLDLDALRAYADANNQVTIHSVWQAMDAKSHIETVNYYLNLDCEIMDNISNGFQHQHPDKFTGSVAHSRVFGSEKVSTDGHTNAQLIAPPTSADNAYKVDSRIRATDTDPIAPGVQVEEFPSDEKILAGLRKAGTTFQLDGTTIEPQDLTTDNFTIRWYVLKYEVSDGWHIDGVLVAKHGRLVVTKTFAGDSEAIERVKDKFSISVAHTESGSKVTDYTLSLNAADKEGDKTKTGYTAYDPETDTYTWALPVRQNRTYNIQEQGYTLNQDKWNNSNQYKIENSEDNDGSWQTYTTKGVYVTAQAYPNDVPDDTCQTVVLRNMYVQAGLLTVNKIDATTGNGLRSVQFKISKVDGTPLTLYKKPGTYEYSTDTGAQTEGYSQVVEGNLLTTDANGYFTIKLGIHGVGSLSEQYYLEETVPTGYEGPTKIRITVTDLGKIEFANEVVNATTGKESQWLEGVGTNLLTIKNRSKLLTAVKAQKDWGDTAENLRRPVTVELWRNNAKLTGSAYTQVLSAANNWQYEWQDLPLYIDGKVAEYSLREVMIGDVAYDANTDSDGYQDYLVSYDATLYKQGADGTYTQDATWLDENGQRQFADHALLTVHNRVLQGTIGLAKVDDSDRPLAGAEFTLYSDAACTQALQTTVSDNSGFVSFGQHPSGTYYIKETKTPANYLPNDKVYVAKVKAGKVTITLVDGTTPVSKIVNYYALRELDFSFIKSDPEGNALGGAKFGLYKLTCTDESHDHTALLHLHTDGTLTADAAACWTLVSLQTSAAKSGLVTFSDLKGNDTYRLVEYAAPSGYTTPAGQWQLTYNTTVTPPVWSITAMGSVAGTPAFEQIEGAQAPYRLTNYRRPDLPTSGDTGIGPYLLLGTGVIAAGAALLGLPAILRRRKDKKQ